MKTRSWIAATTLMAFALGAALVALSTAPEWTTKSIEARAELDSGMRSLMKLYNREAQEHFERALRLDPDFVIAKLRLAQAVERGDPERALLLRRQVAACDESRLTPRGRFMVRRIRALLDERVEEAQQLLDDYLKRSPDDPYVLVIKAAQLFGRGEFAAAEQAYRRLLDVSPNWVTAYNQLGYLTMRQGRFAEAEEYFKCYRFIAPDQANPHDSLGELFVILGRYDEALASFETAVRLRPDFCDTYDHMVLAHALRGDAGAMYEAAASAAANGHCHEPLSDTRRCLAEHIELALDHQWSSILATPPCEWRSSYAAGVDRVIAHRAACETGAWDTALAVEKSFTTDTPGQARDGLTPSVIAHLEGVRLLEQGQPAKAVERFREADRELDYLESFGAVLKLVNRLLLANTLSALDRGPEASLIRADVEAVNPLLAARYP